jgi:hypothetical protein
MAVPGTVVLEMAVPEMVALEMAVPGTVVLEMAVPEMVALEMVSKVRCHGIR